VAPRLCELIELVKSLDMRKHKIFIDTVAAGMEDLKDGISIEQIKEKVRSDIRTKLSR
jgi:hypothetical protein